MSRCLQRFSAVLIATALLLIQVVPAAAATRGEYETRGATNLVADAMFLRPLGLVMIGVGTALWAAVVFPVVLLTRPMDVGDSMGHLIWRPIRYTFGDPLGHH